MMISNAFFTIKMLFLKPGALRIIVLSLQLNTSLNCS